MAGHTDAAAGHAGREGEAKRQSRCEAGDEWIGGKGAVSEIRLEWREEKAAEVERHWASLTPLRFPAAWWVASHAAAAARVE